jgi:MoaA/NifB/PqqE/SkfB family radical SAM enzyme
MLDFYLEQQIDWDSAFRETDPSRRLAVWEQAEAMRGPIPFVEQLEKTNACPLTCVICPRGQGLITREVRHMDDGLFRDICSQIEAGWLARKGTRYDPSLLVPTWSREAIETLGLRLHHFGSPLLDPRFIPRLEWIKAECTFPIHVSLSAEQLRGDQARRPIASGIDRIVVALDGLDEPTYRARRGRAASYAQARDGIEAMLEARTALGSDTINDVQPINRA